MRKGFELKLFDKNNNLIFREFFNYYKTSRQDVENRAVSLLNNPGSVGFDAFKRPASYRIDAS